MLPGTESKELAQVRPSRVRSTGGVIQQRANHMGFPESIKEEVLVACGRHCALCHRFCGLKLELHHIKHQSEGRENTFDNCIPLCFDCHADMRSYDHLHPKGTKYSPSELKRHRDLWFEKVRGSHVASPSASLKVDQELFEEIKLHLDFGREIAFISDHNFGGSFRRKQLSGFVTFASRCRDPEFEFLDSDLEGIRAKLAAAVEVFLGHVGEYTFSQDPKHQILGVEKDWAFKNPRKLDEAVEALNGSSTAIATAYGDLVRACRRKFASLLERETDGG
jgi:hypothetical protein